VLQSQVEHDIDYVYLPQMTSWAKNPHAAPEEFARFLGMRMIPNHVSNSTLSIQAPKTEANLHFHYFE
jgi:hypothetical protein